MKAASICLDVASERLEADQGRFWFGLALFLAGLILGLIVGPGAEAVTSFRGFFGCICKRRNGAARRSAVAAAAGRSWEHIEAARSAKSRF